jgi:Uri superfamily endonuclease
MFKVSFETDNDVFMDGNREAEIARILRKLADTIEEFGTSTGRIYDLNGNTIGTFKNQD